MITIKVGGPQATVELNARRALDGSLLIMDHKAIDIAVMPDQLKVVTFPKTSSTEDVYDYQNRLFEMLADKGIVERDSIRGEMYFVLSKELSWKVNRLIPSKRPCTLYRSFYLTRLAMKRWPMITRKSWKICIPTQTRPIQLSTVRSRNMPRRDRCARATTITRCGIDINEAYNGRLA